MFSDSFVNFLLPKKIGVHQGTMGGRLPPEFQISVFQRPSHGFRGPYMVSGAFRSLKISKNAYPVEKFHAPMIGIFVTAILGQYCGDLFNRNI